MIGASTVLSSPAGRNCFAHLLSHLAPFLPKPIDKTYPTATADDREYRCS
jgi:hypothetical protein